MEGQVFVCSWEKVGKQYRAWVVDRPEVSATGTNLTEVDEALWTAILKATGDGESLREYDPPLPAKAAISGFLKPALVMIDGANTVVRIPDNDLFDGEHCHACGWPRGARTDKALLLDDDYIDSGVDGGIAVIDHKRPAGTRSGTLRLTAHTWRHFFSETFLALLTPTERESFSWRTAQRSGRGRKVYAELLEARTKLPRIAVKSLPVMRQMKGWSCNVCDFLSFPHYGDWDWPTHFVAANDLPSHLPSCFGISDHHGLALGMRAERWRELVGKRGTTGLTSDHVPVVPLRHCDRKPDLPVPL